MAGIRWAVIRRYWQYMRKHVVPVFDLRRLYFYLLVWRVRNVSDRHFFLLLAVLIGLMAGLSAIVVKAFIAWLEGAITHKVPYYMLFLLPIVGLVVVKLLRQLVLPSSVGGGVEGVLTAINRKRSSFAPREMYAHLLLSGLTVSFGGSTGLEAPIVITGSAQGSNLARWFHLDARQRTLFIACGAAAGISAIFNSPIAGVVFALEVLLAEYKLSNFIPILLSAATATFLSKLLAGGERIFTFEAAGVSTPSEAPYYWLMGILLGVYCLYFTWIFFRTEHVLEEIKNGWVRLLIGGMTLSGLVVLFPPLFGEGYLSLKSLLQGRPGYLLTNSLAAPYSGSLMALPLFVLGVLFLKPLATGLTLHAGGSGGIFGPSLVAGGLLGFCFAKFLNLSGLVAPLNETNFTLVGMAGVLGGTMHAPLTAIFLVAEITGGYQLMVPLMTVVALSFVTKTYFQHKSMVRLGLEKAGLWQSRDKDQELLRSITATYVLDRSFPTLPVSASLTEVMQAFTRTTHLHHAVLDEKGLLMGFVALNDLRTLYAEPNEVAQHTTREYIQQPRAIVRPSELGDSILHKFDQHRMSFLPVVTVEGTFLGVIRKSRLLEVFRQRLVRDAKGVVDFSETPPPSKW